MDVSCHRPSLPGTSLEPAVIPTAQASSFTLQYFPYYVWYYYYYYYYYYYWSLMGSYTLPLVNSCRSQWSRGLRRSSTAARLLGLWVRIPPGAWMSVCCECCVLLSGRGLWDELATCPEESYRLWCVVVCDLQSSWMRNQTQSMWLTLSRRCITGCISYMSLIVTVKHDYWMPSDRLQWYWEI